ncbi:MAG TPA: sigma-70 family RNA polymerase sigma factor [Thermoanaerobaculia bacterium]|nr:sigma-70 family RNA polymerase sigma factor [Thermoanaerobaculia bacterium]
MSRPLEDPEQLVAAILAGRPEAEARLIELYGRGIGLLLDRHTGGRPEREDLFQDTFRLALEKLRAGELREPARLPGFLAQLAKNLAIEHYRKQTRRKTEPDSEAGLNLPAPGAGQLDTLLTGERAELARRVLVELGTDRDREILLRFYLAEEDKDQLCRELGLTSLQFNRVLHRARQRYKDLYLAREARLSGSSLLRSAILAALASLLLRRLLLAALRLG